MKSITRIIEEAFFLGFMVSREGFNAECVFDHLAPSRLKPDGQETEEELRKKLEGTRFDRLMGEAVFRITNRVEGE